MGEIYTRVRAQCSRYTRNVRDKICEESLEYHENKRSLVSASFPKFTIIIVIIKLHDKEHVIKLKKLSRYNSYYKYFSDIKISSFLE